MTFLFLIPYFLFLISKRNNKINNNKIRNQKGMGKGRNVTVQGNALFICAINAAQTPKIT
jgi:preprotein translocase subunit YajC